MLTCFPDPYPDELLYSICARFHDRFQFPNKKGSMRELFGSETTLAVVDLPGNLGSLVAALPSNRPYTVDYLIDKHTALPFYAPFLNPKQYRRIRQDMIAAHGPRVHTRSGVMASTIHPPKWLRFCPDCVQEDEQQWGEGYWHRLHQLPGILMCHKHQAYLVNSQVRILNPKTRHEFISARQAVQLNLLPKLDLTEQHQRYLCRLAEDAAWLLQNIKSVPGLDVLLSRYRHLLAKRDLATYNGRVRASKLLLDFTDHYGAEFLRLLECDIDDTSQHNWLFRLVRSPKGSQHPIRHLLLIQFLGHSVESFFKLPRQYRPFGKGPWLCLNKAADHYRQPVIQTIEVTYSPEHGKPMGTFQCDCGFTYSRTGPDLSEEDQLRITKIQSFGSVWDEALKRLWQDPMISLRGIARHLGVDPATVKLHAQALDLNFPRLGKRQTNPMKRTLGSKVKMGKEYDATDRARYREEWLMVQQENPDLGRTALKQKSVNVYTWLRRNDFEWLEQHLPSRRGGAAPKPRVDWDKRDTQLADAVQIAASRLRHKSGKPTQLTVTAIARDLGKVALIQQHLDKLPKTAQSLAQLVENREQFALRRIQWAVENYSLEGVYPPKWKLLRRAGIRPEIEQLPSVGREIEKAMVLLENQVFGGNRDDSIQRLAL
jgi:hypothetical protein